MGLFNFGKTEVAPGIRLSALTSAWPLLSAGQLQAVHIKATQDSKIRPTQSNFGGNLLLPKDVPWPTDSMGRKLIPLAQLNHSEMPRMEGFPERGWTQFYTGQDDTFGMNWDNPMDAANFRVLHIEELDESNANTILHDPKLSPVSVPHALSFSLQQEYTGVYDIRFEQRFGKHSHDFAESFGKGFKSAKHELMKYFSGRQHKVNGYAWFPQYQDPRYRNIAFHDYILLLQIVHQKPGIQWGKEGVGSFFIHPDDLRKKDFSNVISHWDTLGGSK